MVAFKKNIQRMEDKNFKEKSIISIDKIFTD